MANIVFQKYVDFVKADPNARKSRIVGDDKKSCTLPLARITYAHLDAPDEGGAKRGFGKKNEDGTVSPQFSATLLFPADSDLTGFKDMCAKLYIEKFGKPPVGRKWFRLFNAADAAEIFECASCPDLPEGGTQMKVKSTRRPDIYTRSKDGNVRKAPAGAAVSGVWGIATVKPIAYDDPKGGRGFFFALDSILLLLKDELLGYSSVSPEVAYGKVEGLPSDAFEEEEDENAKADSFEEEDDVPF